MDGGFEPHDHADRPAADLRVGLVSRRAHAMDVAQRLAPEIGLGIDLDQQAGERAAGQRCRRFQRLELAGAEVGVDLDHAATGTPDALRDAQKLGLAGRERGREASVAGLVLGGARSREAHGTGAQCLLGEARHLLDLAPGRHFGVLGAAIAHDVEAQCAVWQLGGDVDRAVHRGQGVEIVGEGLPIELHALAQHGAGDIFDAFHQVDQVARGTRPHRGEADAAIAEHRRGDAMPRAGRDERIPGRLAVVVRVDVDEARRHDQARGVDLAPGRAELGADRGDLSILHCDIGDQAWGARAVNHGSVSDDEVKHGGRIGPGGWSGLCSAVPPGKFRGGVEFVQATVVHALQDARRRCVQPCRRLSHGPVPGHGRHGE